MAISKLEYDTARNCVREFDTISSEMRSTFSELKREMDSLEDDLKSRGGDTLYAKYKALADKQDKVIFGGRLGMYKYFDMDDTIIAAWDLAKSII